MEKFIKSVIVGFILSCGQYGNAQMVTLERVEPPNWWVGMETPNLQLLMYGQNISKVEPKVGYEGVRITSTTTLSNPNYLFINICIDERAKPGVFTIILDEDKDLTYAYELKSKQALEKEAMTVDASDVIYLITPDRFANGDRSNDSTTETLEQADRSDENGRHGGDIKGVMDHLDYIENLGVTTLWLNPFLENDQPKYSYHGYGISDFYKTDPRFGTNSDFYTLVNQCHSKGIKMIMDMVFNHCGSGHWWMEDLPASDWINQWESFTRSSFTNIATSDPYVSGSDYDLFIKGWFDTNLPDLNLNNPLLLTYLIQNSIWWVESANLDGIRVDTYPYPDKTAMSGWMKAIKKEYPKLYIVAETWGTSTAALSYWNRKGANKDGYTPLVSSVCDYPLYYSMVKAFGHEGDIYHLYETLAQDFVYGDASVNKIFNGNHDVGRLYTLLDEDENKLKLSMAFMLTTRGIPQIYYGDELMFSGDKPDGNLRRDFPGGWTSDKRDAFTNEGRTDKENNAYEFIRTILNWRKDAQEIHQGKLTHYQPLDNVYVYFRYTESEKTMVILNNSDLVWRFDSGRFKESLKGYESGTDIITKTDYNLFAPIEVNANTAMIVKLAGK